MLVQAPSAAQAYPRYSVQSSQPLMEVADAPNVTPKPSVSVLCTPCNSCFHVDVLQQMLISVVFVLQDPLIQREQLAETVGSKSGPSGKANFEGDATADNPNDSPRPKDRSQMGQPFAQAKSGFGQTLAAAGDQSEDQLVPFADKSNPRLD